MRPLLLVVVGLIAAGCAEKRPPEPQPTKPCPAQGLGVVTDEGTPCPKIVEDTLLMCPPSEGCSAQLNAWATHDCSVPQIYPDRAYQAMQQPVVPGDGRRLYFVLRNAATRGRDLVIDKVELFGDSRCAFRFDAGKDLERRAIPARETTVVRLSYQPAEPGVDSGRLRLHSNAQNFPVLELVFCGRSALAGSPDAGPSSLLVCQATEDVVEPCHR
jgi:hypothetical protein